MFSTILVPLDGSPEACTALPLATEFARGHDCRLVLVRAEDGAAGRAEAESDLRATVANLMSGFTTVETHVLRGSPAETIVAAIGQYDADAVVMATHARTELGRVFMGSVAEQVIAYSHVPVGLVHPGVTGVTPLRSILVPLDETAGSRRALEVATRLAREQHAEVRLLTVVRPMPGYVARPIPGLKLDALFAPTWQEARQHAEEPLQRTATSLRRHGVHASAHAVIGETAHSIADDARETGADLIVMSTHALVGPLRTMLGSMATSVLREASCPVLLVHRG
jgi:nucleotide-binding universal stress UspA family protein